MGKYILRKYLLFVIALFINAFGVAFVTKALLGTSPITSITYVLSLFTSLTMGEWTIIVNILFVVLELPFMNKKWLHDDLRLYLLQIPVSFFLGIFIDCSMNLLHSLNPNTYMMQLLSLFIGCIILGIGIALEVKANVAMASGEYFVNVIAKRFKWDFGYVKLGFDTTLVALSCIVSLIFMQGIFGIREGTVIAALVVGPIVHWISPYLHFMDRWIGNFSEIRTSDNKQLHHVIITIAREYGSGGHSLGEMLSNELGLKLYDKELIHLAAQKSGINEEYIKENEQALPSFWLKYLFSRNDEFSLEQSLSPDDVLFVAESKVIQEVSEKESCIIVGRCADYILKENPSVIRIFCYTDLNDASIRCIKKHGIAEDSVEETIKTMNNRRRTHYEYYTGRKWGDYHHYDLMINTSIMPLQTACNIIKELYKNISKQTH